MLSLQFQVCLVHLVRELSAEDSFFLLNTPEMAQCGEFSGSNPVFFSTTKQLFTFVDNINKVSMCCTPGCHGKLKHVSRKLVCWGIEMHFDCSGCDRRCVTYPASALHEQSQQPTLSLSLQVACIAAGLSYVQYQQLFGSGVGLKCVSPKVFYQS